MRQIRCTRHTYVPWIVDGQLLTYDGIEFSRDCEPFYTYSYDHEGD